MAYRSSRGFNFFLIKLLPLIIIFSKGPSSSTANYTNGGYMLEQQNEEMVEELSNKVSQLKRVTIAIGDDVREQNKLLNEMVGLPAFILFQH